MKIYYKEIKDKFESVTVRPFAKSTESYKVGSVYCQECRFFSKINEEQKYVICNKKESDSLNGL